MRKGLYLADDAIGCGTGTERLMDCACDHRSVGDRVVERDTHFDEIETASGDRVKTLGKCVLVRVSSGEIYAFHDVLPHVLLDDAQVLVAPSREVHQDALFPRSSAACSIAHASACDDSSAGRIPSSLVSSWKALRAASVLNPVV